MIFHLKESARELEKGAWIVAAAPVDCTDTCSSCPDSEPTVGLLWHILSTSLFP